MESFPVTSGKLQVTDPCYDINVWCTATLDNVKNGTYFVEIDRIKDGYFGDRVTELVIYHESVIKQKSRLKFKWRDSNIGVDSGQAGFFDYNKLVEVKINKELDNTFYNQMCQLTSESDNFGTNEFGVVSSSGFGDGVYSLYVAEKGGQVVAAKIVFIDEEGEDFEDSP